MRSFCYGLLLLRLLNEKYHFPTMHFLQNFGVHKAESLAPLIRLEASSHIFARLKTVRINFPPFATGSKG